MLQIYPALVRRRALAVRLAVLRPVAPEDLLHDPGSSLAAPLLADLGAELVQLRVDATQYAGTYYFRDGDEEVALPAMIRVATSLAETGRSAPRPDVRVAAALLAGAVDDSARVLDDQFLHTGGGTAEILEAYARAHQRAAHD
ncbi:hypothetical protein [Blastococcus aurantiacus]|uniref:hypothetical protein n=1 Tax=Blastococcus aurantiacus TaxID=1550231 RepID=UPI000B865856|nr:hypothetical protein [Blastococcus aurantiacus]